MIAKFSYRSVILLLPLGLAACADSFVTGQPQPSSKTLLREYDNTLSKQQQQAVIGELKADAQATGSVAAKSPEKQN